MWAGRPIFGGVWKLSVRRGVSGQGRSHRRSRDPSGQRNGRISGRGRARKRGVVNGRRYWRLSLSVVLMKILGKWVFDRRPAVEHIDSTILLLDAMHDSSCALCIKSRRTP